MGLFYLVVRGESGKYTRGDCVVIDLNCKDIETARERAEFNLIGDPDRWEGSLSGRGLHTGELSFIPYFSNASGDYGAMLDRGEEVHEAFIVEAIEPINIDALRKRMSAWGEKEETRLRKNLRRAKYEELKREFGNG